MVEDNSLRAPRIDLSITVGLYPASFAKNFTAISLTPSESAFTDFTRSVGKYEESLGKRGAMKKGIIDQSVGLREPKASKASMTGE